MALEERAVRMVEGQTTLEEEIGTASTTERMALCLIAGKHDLLAYGDPLRAWIRLDNEQRAVVQFHNERAAEFCAVETEHLARAARQAVKEWEARRTESARLLRVVEE